MSSGSTTTFAKHLMFSISYGFQLFLEYGSVLGVLDSFYDQKVIKVHQNNRIKRMKVDFNVYYLIDRKAMVFLILSSKRLEMLHTDSFNFLMKKSQSSK